jgi:hypothetical protein
VTQFITVLFTCHGCGLQRVRVLVRARERGEDLILWMQAVRAAVTKRHAGLAATCGKPEFDLAIPVAREGDGVGMSMAENVPDKLSDDFMKSRGAN